jgi:multiple sugar transport system substrate-binding protein
MKRLSALFSPVCLALPLFAGGGPEAAKDESKSVRVLLVNHPYGELLKGSVQDFEKQTGIKVLLESLQEARLLQKLTTEFNLLRILLPWMYL